jgi:hypothetical protein
VSRLFGEIRQNGYVVRDVEAAMQHWSEVLGVGPWYYFERVPIDDFRFRGSASNIDVSIALANSGPLQIELIEQRNAAPSMYRDFMAEVGEGLQHVAYWTEHFDRDLVAAEARGFRVGQSGQINGGDGRFVYFESDAHNGSVIELSEISGPKGRFFASIRRAAQAWDGSEPIRRPGRPQG